MKIYLTILCIALTAITSLAQENADSTKHMIFKGVPIDGTLNEYVLQMKTSGFTHLGTENGNAQLTGEFAAYKGCFLEVSSLKQIDLVNQISVVFPVCDTWSSLSQNYFNLKELLTEKYGAPSEISEVFDNSNLKGDDLKMYMVKNDNCKYHSVFETEKGSIRLSIDYDRMNGCFVRLSYFDKINSKLIREKAKGDL